MTDTVKDLDYYAANPHEMPADFMSLGNEAEPKDEEVSATSGAEAAEKEPESKQDEVEAKAPEAEPEQEPEGVASKNGKHVLPYSALVTERERRQAAEKAMQELSDRIKALEGSSKAGESEAPPAEENAVTDDELEAMINDFPQIGGPVKALLAKVGKLESALNSVAQLEEQRAQQEAKQRTLTVQEAIEATPALFYWQNTSPEMFDIAVSFDDQIKRDPRNQSLSLQDRFTKVVAAVEAVYGQTDLPAEYRPKQTAPSESVDTLANKAKEKIEQAEKKARPKTISDLPGGEPPATSQDEQMAGMSVEELGSMMLKMSPQQVSELLSRVG